MFIPSSLYKCHKLEEDWTSVFKRSFEIWSQSRAWLWCNLTSKHYNSRAIRVIVYMIFLFRKTWSWIPPCKKNIYVVSTTDISLENLWNQLMISNINKFITSLYVFWQCTIECLHWWLHCLTIVYLISCIWRFISFSLAIIRRNIICVSLFSFI